MFLSLSSHSLSLNKQTKKHFFYDPAITLLGAYPNEMMKTYIHAKPAHKCLQELYS